MVDSSVGGRGKQIKRTPTIGIKLASSDFRRFDEFCRSERTNRSDMARRAILEYMDRRQQEEVLEVQDKFIAAFERFEERRRRDTERICKLIARALMDIGMINQVFYNRAAPEDREKLWGAARQAAAQRLKSKRKDADPEATEILNYIAGEIRSQT